ncbi:hypothetical protein D3C79_885770 [compost metagenome]
MASHVHFGGLWQDEILECAQRSILCALVQAGSPLEHRRGHGKGGIGHAQRLENTLLHDFTQTLAGNGLDHQAGPIHVGAVFPLFTRLKQQGCLKRRQRPADDAGLSLCLG